MYRNPVNLSKGKHEVQVLGQKSSCIGNRLQRDRLRAEKSVVSSKVNLNQQSMPAASWSI